MKEDDAKMTRRGILLLAEKISTLIAVDRLQDALDKAQELVGALEAKCGSQE